VGRSLRHGAEPIAVERQKAAGDLTGDEDLQREGQLDQAGAKVKEKLNEGVDKVKDLVDDDED